MVVRTQGPIKTIKIVPLNLSSKCNKIKRVALGIFQSFFVLGGWANPVVEPKTLEDITLYA